MRIFCTECNRFVDLPDQTEILGRFACADCRRDRRRSQPMQAVPRPAQRVATPLAERRRARQSSRPPPPPSVTTDALAIPALPAVPVIPPPPAPPAEVVAPPTAAPVAAPPRQPSSPSWALPVAPAAALPPSGRRRALLAAGLSGLCAVVVGAAVLLRPTDAPESAAAPAAAATATSAQVVANPEPSSAKATGGVDRGAINDELTRLANEADGCRKSGDPAGVARVRVTFSPSGSTIEAVVEKGAFSGKNNRVGKCIAALFETAKIEPFTGQPITITKSVVIR